jgi:hypothetical protein
MNDAGKRFGQRTRLFGVLVAGAAALVGCGNGAATGPRELGTIRAAVSFAPSDGVSAVRIDVSRSGGVVATRTIPVGGPPPDGGPAGDAFFVLAPGTYTVTATALDANGNESRTCMSASVSAQVTSGQTTEITLALLCSGPGNGGLDVVITAEHAPAITNLVFDPSKFVLACQPVTVAVTASSPEGLPVTYAWSVASAPAGTELPSGVAALIVPSGSTAVIDTATPGDYSFSVLVTDSKSRSASLTFPVHVLANADCVPAPPPTPPTPLPAPPRDNGCYFYDDGSAAWVSTPCLDDVAAANFPPPAIPIALQSSFFFTDQTHVTQIPLVFGQTEMIVRTIGSVTDQFVPHPNDPGCPTSGTDVPNRFSLQGNANAFFGTNGDIDAVQWTTQYKDGDTGICLWQIDVVDFDDPNAPEEFHKNCTHVSSRSGGLVTNDRANIESFVDPVAKKLSMVAHVTWFKQGQPSSFAIVTNDMFGLGTTGNFTEYDGNVLGLGDCSNAEFTNTWIDVRLAVSSCPGDTQQSDPVCSGSPLQPHVVIDNPMGTAETNNLTVLGTPTVGYLNADLAVTDFSETTGLDVTMPTLQPGPTGVLCPDNLVQGDREFGGNGPQITVHAHTLLAADSKSFSIAVDFDAVETGGDHSEVTGNFVPFTWNAPEGQHITSIVSGISSSVSALSAAAGAEVGACNDGDVIANPTITGDLIAAIQLIGDTGGDDISSDTDCSCDTQIKNITFNPVVVQLVADSP